MGQRKIKCPQVKPLMNHITVVFESNLNAMTNTYTECKGIGNCLKSFPLEFLKIKIEK
jgi:hypothetical protein